MDLAGKIRPFQGFRYGAGSSTTMGGDGLEKDRISLAPQRVKKEKARLLERVFFYSGVGRKLANHRRKGRGRGARRKGVADQKPQKEKYVGAKIVSCGDDYIRKELEEIKVREG